MSDVLNGYDTPITIERLDSPPSEEQTEVQSLGNESFTAPIPSCPLFVRVLAVRIIPYLDRECLKALRSTCKEWRMAIDRDTPPRKLASHCLPTEILQSIYKYLDPRTVSRNSDYPESYSSKPVQRCTTYLPSLDVGEPGPDVTAHYA